MHSAIHNTTTIGLNERFQQHQTTLREQVHVVPSTSGHATHTYTSGVMARTVCVLVVRFPGPNQLNDRKFGVTQKAKC